MKIDPFTREAVRILSQMHVAFYRFWSGKTLLNRNTLILTVKGRRTGREIAKPLLYVENDGRCYLAASYGGSDSPPGWYLNLSANPEVKVERGAGPARNYRARTLEAGEAEAIWPRLVAIYPAYESYRRRTTRAIPVVELTPID